MSILSWGFENMTGLKQAMDISMSYLRIHTNATSFRNTLRKGEDSGKMIYLNPANSICLDVFKQYWVYAEPVCGWEVRGIYTSKMDLIRAGTTDPNVHDRSLEKGEMGPLTWIEVLVELSNYDTMKFYI